MEHEIQQPTESTTERPAEGRQQGPDLDRESLSRMDASRFAGSTASQYLGNMEITGQTQQAGAQSADYCPVIPQNPSDLGRQLGRTRDAELGPYGSQIQMRERENPGFVERTNDYMRREGIPRHIRQSSDGSYRVGPAMVDIGTRQRPGQRWW